MRVQVEVCVTSVGEARTACLAGADRVELCSWAECGGITPSMGLTVEVGRVVEVPLRLLVRPRPGDFLYDRHELAILRLDAHAFAALPRMHGLVVGALDADGLPDRVVLEGLRAAHPDHELTFHRAIDRSRDLHRALIYCQDAGMRRILTSGGRDRAAEGVAMIAELVKKADGLRIAAAGGIGPDNVVRIVERTGVEEVHFSARMPAVQRVHEVALSSDAEGVGPERSPDRAKIDRVLEALDKAGLR
ncbi:MAG: copper homeostasis protein CutC [Flavobacteriales bacterium]|nr:copper homeostasis protein CutC [Flavobacteriales bacterium]MCB9194077.1 copper homeostasis protein CutC [Flavobacteriales bacterium]